MTTVDLSGRVALVTGAAQGLGECMAHTLASAGAQVVIADINEALGERVASSLNGVFVKLDVTDDLSWEAGLARAVTETGGLDILVNNAGIEITGLLVDLDPVEVRRMFDINVLGTALGIKHAFRAMRPGGAAGGGGVVINISSVTATIAYPALAAYSATKSAVDRLTRVAAAESGKLGYGVRVNTVYPGLVANAMGAALARGVARLVLYSSQEEAIADVVSLTPSGRLASPDDVARVVAFLASDQADFINAAGVPVDGGMGQ